MIFLQLLLGHLIADFVLQPAKLIAWKRRSWKGVAFHALAHFSSWLLLFSPFLWINAVIPILAAMAALHFAVDRLKIIFEQKTNCYLALFFLDQAAHLLVLLAGARMVENAIPFSPDYGLFLNLYFTIYFILAIISSYFLEIARFQIERKKKHNAEFKPNFGKMLIRLLILSCFYVIFMVFSIYEIAKTTHL